MMNNWLNFFVLGIVGFLALRSAHAQIQVESDLTLEYYVNEVLLGGAGTASNITYLGGASQIGYLTGAEDALGFESGLVMSCDVAENVSCPSDFLSCNGCLGASYNDVDLLAIANSVPPLIGESFSVNSVNDGCVLEFDFVAGIDNLSLEFVFGSDEYDTYINTPYNDVFACFLSGPGITGPYASPAGFSNGAVNIAVVPDSDPALPITVSSVNAELNSEYFISNQGNSGFCINGYTTPITANHPLICGGTYHMKLAIADGSDTALESVLVVRQGSFDTAVPAIQPQFSFDFGNGDVIYEDCGAVTLTFERAPSSNIQLPDTFYVEYSGQAINGVDYGIASPGGGLDPLPTTFIIPAFENSLDVPVEAAIDEVDEGLESAQFDIEFSSACSDESIVIAFPFSVGEVPPALAVIGSQATICSGEEITIGPTVFGGVGNYVYEWSCPEGNGQSSVTISPTSDWSCFVAVSDTCGLSSMPDEVEINVIVLEYPELSVELSPIGPLMLGCSGTASLVAETSGGDGTYTYEWTDNNGNVLFPSFFDSSELDFNGSPEISSIQVVVTDGCGFTDEDSVDVIYDVLPIDVSVQENWFVECFEELSIAAEATGTGALSFQWFDAGGNVVSASNTLEVVISEDTSYLLQVQDNCGQSVLTTVTVATNCIEPEDDLCVFVEMGDNGLLPDDQTQCFSNNIEVYLGDEEPILSDFSELLFFVNMEHSFMGDLTITMICPNGQSMSMHQQGGGGTNLGVPDQGDGTGPGTGWDYYWSSSASNGTWGENSGSSLPAGTYESAQPFTLLEGCPINGQWTLEICDSWGADDGYLFQWGMDFAACSAAPGCIDEAACNFYPAATYDDGSCIYPGCTDQFACNYNPEAGCDDGSCLPYDAVMGCMDEMACNYNGSALCPDGSCIYPLIEGDCDAGVIFCSETTVWDAIQQLCVCGDVEAEPELCPSDLNGNGLVEVTDLLLVLGDFGIVCE